MAKKAHHEEHENHERWLVSYADFITLLFAFFVVMYSISMINEGKFKVFSEALKRALAPVVNAPASNRRFDLGDSAASLIPAISAKMQFLQQVHAVVNKVAMGEQFKGKITVTTVERGVLITVADSVLFESGRADLRPEALPLLEALAAVVTKTDHGMVKEIRVEGHTDNVPIRTLRFPSNWDLSSGRAVSVVRALTESYNVSPVLVSASGFGEFRPVADNLTPSSRAKNRRVELTILTE